MENSNHGYPSNKITNCGHRIRISNLKLDHNLNISTEKLKKINKFGNTYTYCQHSILESEKQDAIDLYYELWSKTK